MVMKLSAHKFEHRTHFKDYAILYRGNHQARLFEQQLRNHKIPYAISGGRSFFENAEIKDLFLPAPDRQRGRRPGLHPRLSPCPAAASAPPPSNPSATTPRTATSACSGHLRRRGRGRARGGRGSSNPLREFCHFMNRIAHRAPREPAGRSSTTLLKAINYEAWLYESCEPREAETKWSNVGDFTGWLGRKGEEDGKTSPT